MWAVINSINKIFSHWIRDLSPNPAYAIAIYKKKLKIKKKILGCFSIMVKESFNVKGNYYGKKAINSNSINK